MSAPDDVLVARSVRALRTAMLLPLAAAFGLGVLAAAILVLAGTPESRIALWPGLSTLLIGQFAALAAGTIAFAGLQRALRPGTDHAAIRAGTATALRRVPRPLFAVLVGATAAWALVEPGAGIEALVCALVAAQVAVPVAVAARTLEAAPSG